ncbi:HIT family protein [Lichenihabitans sp. Uapishka_5]|uniref:HIT family protein n=1 Tax=Lichenihabitans sp. Uapishka_5 TaxID=3037302 RepID=UPI0029E7E419|nr:HIT family protein [Lichenihabitans sp. Uapishka_5]MDX7949779.1 HIT family protein [Lichenihabitans sp. Uapishka_5]
MTFTLDPRLEADTLPLGLLGLCAVRLTNDARYPWLVLVPRRPDLVEVFDLTAAERGQLMEEVAAVSRALDEVTGADKINIGALGNIVSQLHVHVVARQEDDAAWPGPVWGSGSAVPYGDAELDVLRQTLSTALAFG